MHITVVDDEQENLNWLTSTLSNDFELHGVNDPLKTVEYLTENPTEILLLDVHMKRLSGFELIKKVQKSFPKLPVIFISADSSNETICQALKLGADDYICKPCRPMELTARIKNKVRIRKEIDDNIYIISFSHYLADSSKQFVYLNGLPVELLNIEYRILRLLCSHMDKFVSHDLMRSLLFPYIECSKAGIQASFQGLRDKLSPISDSLLLTKGDNFILKA